jgi:hypothetical protein
MYIDIFESFNMISCVLLDFYSSTLRCCSRSINDGICCANTTRIGGCGFGFGGWGGCGGFGGCGFGCGGWGGCGGFGGCGFGWGGCGGGFFDGCGFGCGGGFFVHKHIIQTVSQTNNCHGDGDDQKAWGNNRDQNQNRVVCLNTAVNNAGHGFGENGLR